MYIFDHCLMSTFYIYIVEIESVMANKYVLRKLIYICPEYTEAIMYIL